MKRLTLDETWVLCLKMWKWIAAQKKENRRKDGEILKIEWLESHGYRCGELHLDCFFCEYGYYHAKGKKGTCDKCPARKINPKFDCLSIGYGYNDKPIAFYAKLVALNKKRKSKEAAAS